MRFQQAYARSSKFSGCEATCQPLVLVLSLYIIYTYGAIYYSIASVLLFLKSPKF